MAVGRWESYQKNLPLLLLTLRSFLGKNQTWEALVVGTGLPPDFSHPRIRFSSPLDPAALASEMRSSKIFLSSSRYESFGLAAAEALACGCVLVANWGHPWAPTHSVGHRKAELLQRLTACAHTGVWGDDKPSWTKGLAPAEVASQFLKL
jgi:hypothetical protein